MSDVNQAPGDPISVSEAGRAAASTQSASEALEFEPFDAKTVMDTILKGLPEPTTSRLWGDELRHLPDGGKDSSWQNCFKAVEKHDKDLCQTYREQIDTLLVFAGLFSAVVTAFVVESYQWLQDDPADSAVVLLRDMVLLMAHASNQTVEPPPLKQSNLSAEVIVRINVFWFVSLCLSLSAALVGILCKQWVREYERDVGMSPQKALAVRHIKFKGLEYWNVGAIANSVPIILQIALALFLLGVLDLLWRLHAAVAGCVTAVAVLTLGFYLSTTFLPLIQYAYICIQCCRAAGITDIYCRVKAFTGPQCAFKSPQAWIAVLTAQPIIECCMKMYARCFTCYCPPGVYPLEVPRADSWVRFDINWMRRRDYLHRGPHAAYEALSWAARHLDEADLSLWIWHCVWARCSAGLGVVDDSSDTTDDIGCVADAYPMLVRLGTVFPAHVRAASLAFRCSLRTDLPANTVLELLMRVSLDAGVNSQWTQEALNAVVALYEDRLLDLSDHVSLGLLDLAERQSYQQWQTDLQIVTNDRNPHFPFLQIARLIARGSRLCVRLLPAMCALGVPWLAVQSRGLVKVMARDLLELTMDIYAGAGYTDWQLLECPGVLLVARFANITTTIWPDFLTRWATQPKHHAVLGELLSIWSSRGENAAAPSSEAPAMEPARVPADVPERLVSSCRDDVRITVYETQGATAETDLNTMADPSNGPAGAA